MSTDPPLPVELEQEIFEMTAIYHPGTMPNLLRVSKRVGSWIKPLLYRVVVVTPAAADTARAALHALKSRDKLFAKYVRHIWLEGSKLSIADAHDLLRISTQLTDLTVVAPFCTPALLPILRKLHLERFTGSLRLLFGDNAINLADTALESLTHLHIFDSIADHEQIRERLKSLKSLTHLTVPEITGPATSVCDTIRIVFDQCPELKIFVALCNADAKPSTLPYDIPDQHLRRLVLTNFSWTAETWASGAMGGVDLWAAAEEYIARKQRGELPASFSWLETSPDLLN
ncbi:hypothetical protein B0H13DRAFT_2455425 [Mycena leptocephala]|nr:hypothetical protein B0H13DRAFT_2455425 [Mycena leptocephala]